jgi:hypothetical protein
MSVDEASIVVAFRPTGRRYVFARTRLGVSPAPPDVIGTSGPHPTWEVDWLARKAASEALCYS